MRLLPQTQSKGWSHFDLDILPFLKHPRVRLGSHVREHQQCTGQRPCIECITRGLQCVYETHVGETRAQASKRKYEDLDRSHEALLELINIAAGRQDGPDIFTRVKNGEDIESILTMLKQGDVMSDTYLQTDAGIRCTVLSHLIQSTASVEQIIDFAPLLTSLRPDVLESKGFRRLQNRVIDPTRLAELITNGDGPVSRRLPQAPMTDGALDQDPSDAAVDVPAFAVRAQPWTRLTMDNNLVSHLVSVFLNTSNVYWRYLEMDLFLEGMRSGDPFSKYCSPFLVNAICAIASVRPAKTMRHAINPLIPAIDEL